MWVVYGIDERSKRVDTGEFYCVQCGEDRLYDHVQARRWFHVYGVGVIPLNRVADFAECITCHQVYNPDVVHLAAELRQEQKEYLEAALLAVMGWMIAAEDGVDADQAEAAVAICTEQTGVAWTMESFLDVIAHMLDDDHFADRLAEHVDPLADPPREAIFAGAYRVATADGPLSSADTAKLRELAALLGFTEATCARLVESCLARAA